MTPEKNARCNMTYLGPNEHVADLPCQREVDENGNRIIWSFWRPSAQEIENLTRGGVVVLGIWNHEPIPPVSLGVEFCASVEEQLKSEMTKA